LFPDETFERPSVSEVLSFYTESLALDLAGPSGGIPSEGFRACLFPEFLGSFFLITLTEGSSYELADPSSGYSFASSVALFSSSVALT
jgi:hypothetical protein